MQKRALASILFGGLLALTVPAAGLHADSGHGHEFSVNDKLDRMTKELSLTAEQQSSIRPILEEKKSKTAALKEQMKAVQEETRQKITAVLTDDQKTKYENMKKDKMGKKDKMKDKKK